MSVVPHCRFAGFQDAVRKAKPVLLEPIMGLKWLHRTIT